MNPFDLRCESVTYISYNMSTCDLPDMYALSTQACDPQALGIHMHISQITLAHVTTITCITECTHLFMGQNFHKFYNL